MTSSVIGVSWFLQVNFWPPYSKTPVQVICVFASMMPSSRPAMADRQLEGRAGRIHAARDAVHLGMTAVVCTVIGRGGRIVVRKAVRRVGRHREHLACIRVERDRRAAPAVSGKVFRERTLRDLLQIEVKGRHDVVSRPGRRGGLLRDLAAAEVGLHRARTGRAVQIALERFFQTGLADDRGHLIADEVAL